MDRIETTVVANADALGRLIESSAGAGRFAVADLSLGSWEPQALALQILGQLTGRPLALKASRRSGSASMPLADAMSAGIDQEGRGHRSLLRAFQTARQIGAVLRRSGGTVFVIAPAFGIAWRRDDRLLLDFLCRDGPAGCLRLVVIADEASRPPVDTRHAAAEWITRLPGAIAPTDLDRLGDAARGALRVLRNGWAIVRPELRRRPPIDGPRPTRDEVDRLLAQGPRHGVAWARLHGPAAPGDDWIFCRDAWRHFDEGYRELAFGLIDRAVDAASDAASREVFDCHRQAMRLAGADYAAAGAAAPASPTASEATRRFLLETRGWGLVMSDQAEAALPLLREALAAHAASPPDRLLLFLMNITALAEVRCGHHDAAYRLERQIERLIVEHRLDDARLQFVNWMNLARLERYAKRFDEAERCYRLAFGTVEGARTEADSINVNLCIERLDAARGRPRAALAGLVRAALHWLAAETPEALSWRVQGMILGRRAAVDVATLDEAVQAVEAVAAALLAKLREAGTACGIDLSPGAACDFAYADCAHGLVTVRVGIGGEGWAVLGADGTVRRPGFGPRHRALRAWLTAWVRRSGGAAADCFLIDRGSGGEMPLDADESVASGLEWGASQIVFEGRDITPDPAQRERRRGRRCLRLNPIVAKVDGEAARAVVHYRRYLPPGTLTDDGTLLLRASADEPRVLRLEARLTALGWTAERIGAAVGELRERRVLRLSTAEDG